MVSSFYQMEKSMKPYKKETDVGFFVTWGWGPKDTLENGNRNKDFITKNLLTQKTWMIPIVFHSKY